MGLAWPSLAQLGLLLSFSLLHRCGLCGYRGNMKVKKNLMNKPLTPLQWGSAPTHSTNVSMVRHVKATVGCRIKKNTQKWSKLQKHNSATNPWNKPSERRRVQRAEADRQTPPTGQRCQVRSLVVAAAPVLLSVCLRVVCVRVREPQKEDRRRKKKSRTQRCFIVIRISIQSASVTTASARVMQ